MNGELNRVIASEGVGTREYGDQCLIELLLLMEQVAQMSRSWLRERASQQCRGNWKRIRTAQPH